MSLKSRKFFAILIVAMMVMALLPVGALAAPDRFASIVESNKTSVAADNSSTIKFTITAYDSSYTLDSSQDIYFASKRGDTDIFRDKNGVALPAANHASTYVAGTNPLYKITPTSGVAEVWVTSAIAGSSEIAFGLVDATTGAYGFLTGLSGATEAAAQIIDSVKVEFTSPSLDAITVAGAPTASTGTAVTGTGASATPYNAPDIMGNSIGNYEISFKVTANTAPVSGQDVTFSANKPEVTLSKTTEKTSAAGVVKVKAFASKPGTYSVKATCGSEDATVYVNFNTNDPFDVSLESDANQVVAKDQDFKLKFKIVDVNGNKVSIPKLAAAVDAATLASTTPVNVSLLQLGLKFEAVTRPADVRMPEKIYETSSTAKYEFNGTTDGLLEMVIKGAELNKEGDYKLKAYYDAGKFVEVPFKVQKQGTVTQLTISYKQSSVPVGTSVPKPTVKRLDANGVSKTLSAGDVQNHIVFSASDMRKISDVVGDTKLQNGTGGDEGAFTLKSDEKWAGTLVITAVDTDKNMTATATIEVTKPAIALKLTNPETATTVGKDATVKMQIVDVDDVAVALGDAVTAVDITITTLSKPADSMVSTSSAATRLTDIQEKGSVDLKVSSNVSGKVMLQVTARITSAGVEKAYTNSVVVDFGEAVPEKEAPDYGAANVTMFIDSKGYVVDGTGANVDVAPFIENGRTFVPVRFIAEALGAEADWEPKDAAVEVVTLTRPDLLIEIKIGEKAITVFELDEKADEWVESATVEMDTAAMIKDGRTFLPFRYVAEAFGADVTYGPEDGPVEWVSFAQ